MCDRWAQPHWNRALEALASEGVVFSGHPSAFKGNIIPGMPCVVSFPGKHESAWDVLVRASRGGHLSVAEVFMPQGSREFGIHDPIPKAEELPGDCWCVPLYGEEKPWGCRWWTHWIQNIEEAVATASELQVYFFHNKRGLGKVKSFSTCGQENLQRESIYHRNRGFEESLEFQYAVASGLKNLSLDKAADGSSPYSRELRRLFLAWLPEEDREFLVASEGLGMSQKAQVAWLERKGYPYKEVDVVGDFIKHIARLS